MSIACENIVLRDLQVIRAKFITKDAHRRLLLGDFAGCTNRHSKVALCSQGSLEIFFCELCGANFRYDSESNVGTK